MTERKMATIRKIDKIEPIPDADKIVKATVGGWQLVTAIDNGFKEGDLVVYCEIDSFIPTTIAPFLTKPGQYPKMFNNVEGERLRTVKLRGQVSQGLLLPLSIAAEKFEDSKFDEGQELSEFFFPGNDVSELLGIQKFEAEIPACLAGEVRGMFPSFIPKTDEERIQNLTTEFEEWKGLGLTWEKTEKLDGSSMTVYMRDGDFGVCSRNLDLKRNEDNSLWRVAIRDSLEEVLKDAGNYALQGELIGSGIQGNPYKYKDQQFYIFNIYDINNSVYFTPEQRHEFATKYKLKHIPVMEKGSKLDGLTIANLLTIAEGKSVMGDITGPEREGDVYKCNERTLSFKVISNRFLLKTGG